MKFKLKDHVIGPESFNPVDDYLRSIGIEETRSFINRPSESDEETWKTIHNIDKAVAMLKKHIDNDSSIFLQVDK